MKKMSVTYKAAPGEPKVLEAFGHTFFDGKSEDVTVDDDTAEKLRGNSTFKCGEPQDVEPGDTKLTEAEIKAKEDEDKRKLEAQGIGGPAQRGAVLNKPEPQPEHDKESGKEAGASTKGFHQNPNTQAGRDR
jgi:hypothetical protein